MHFVNKSSPLHVCCPAISALLYRFSSSLFIVLHITLSLLPIILDFIESIWTSNSFLIVIQLRTDLRKLFWKSFNLSTWVWLKPRHDSLLIISNLTMAAIALGIPINMDFLLRPWCPLLSCLVLLYFCLWSLWYWQPFFFTDLVSLILWLAYLLPSFLLVCVLVLRLAQVVLTEVFHFVTCIIRVFYPYFPFIRCQFWSFYFS